MRLSSRSGRARWVQGCSIPLDYASTRIFLERLNSLSEQKGCFPDISFGRTYVNLTVRAEGEGAEIGPSETSFAAAIDDLL